MRYLFTFHCIKIKLFVILGIMGNIIDNRDTYRENSIECSLTEDKIMTKNKLLRMDNVSIVVESLDDAISFFSEIGLKLEGRAKIEGEWAGRVTGLGTQNVEIAMMVTPDGHSRLELSKFITPQVVSDHRNAPVNALGYLRVMFTVEDIDELVFRLIKHGAKLVGDIVQYENSYRLCYIRAADGLLIGLAEELNIK